MIAMGRSRGEAGLTLVEVLAALVIMSIVFIGFMSIFPQMTNFNAKTGTKLETMNIARQEIAEIQGQSFDLVDTEIAVMIQDLEPLGERIEVSAVDDGTKITAKYTRDKLKYEVDFFKQHDFYPEMKVSGDSYPYKVHLKVYANEKQSSETYGYILITES